MVFISPRRLARVSLPRPETEMNCERNPRGMARLMREDNPPAVQPRAWIQTTDSGHELEVSLHLARMKCRDRAMRPNDLWHWLHARRVLHSD